MKIVESHWSWLWWRKLSFFFLYRSNEKTFTMRYIFISLHKIKSKQRFFLTQSSLYYVLPSNDLQYKYWLQWLPQSDFNQFFKSNPNIIFARVFFYPFFSLSHSCLHFTISSWWDVESEGVRKSLKNFSLLISTFEENFPSP